MPLDKINIVISTIWREKDYLEATLESLASEQSPNVDQPVCLVVGSPVTTHLERYRSQPGIAIVEMGPNTWAWIKNNFTHQRAAWNYYRCLTQPVAGARGTLILEDDIRFARGWRARLGTTLGALEEQYGPDFVLTVYAAWFSKTKEKNYSRLYVEYPHDAFSGTQGIYYPMKVRQGFAKHLKAHGLKASGEHYDIILKKYLIQSGIPLFATAPCLIQHMGKTSVIDTPWHESWDFVEDVTVSPECYQLALPARTETK